MDCKHDIALKEPGKYYKGDKIACYCTKIEKGKIHAVFKKGFDDRCPLKKKK